MTSGVYNNGGGDELAFESGLRTYFENIFAPIILKLFGDEITMRCNYLARFKELSSVLAIFETSSYIDDETKKKFVKEFWSFAKKRLRKFKGLKSYKFVLHIALHIRRM
ncbi:MAG: hypothetical protein LBF97_07580 [Elusimicrobiota bacterium]|nr:hypothetical protein [Elusimicrobiota bacterium]